MNAATIYEGAAANAFDSYNNSYAVLKSRFFGRGVLEGARMLVEEQIKSEDETRLSNPAAYLFGNVMEHDYKNKYRTGAANGTPYMTVDDLKRLYYTEAGYRAGEYGARRTSRKSRARDLEAAMVAARPAAPYRVLEERRVGEETEALWGTKQLVASQGKYRRSVVERADGTAKCVETYKKWFPSNEVIKTSGLRRRRSTGTLAAAVLSLLFAFVLALPVFMNIMINDVSGEVGALQSEIREKEEEVRELEVLLRDKNRKYGVEELAVTRYGMIKADKANLKKLDLKQSDGIESFDYEQSESRGIVPALLSALGIKRGS